MLKREQWLVPGPGLLASTLKGESMGKTILKHVSLLMPYLSSVRKDGRKQKPELLIAISALTMLTASVAFAQTIPQPSIPQPLVERSSIIVRGKILKMNASDEKLLQ